MSEVDHAISSVWRVKNSRALAVEKGAPPFLLALPADFRHFADAFNEELSASVGIKAGEISVSIHAKR